MRDPSGTEAAFFVLLGFEISYYGLHNGREVNDTDIADF